MDTDTTDTLDAEAWLLRNGHWQIEVMTHLDQIPSTGSLIVVVWPKPEGGLGFPVRAFAILPSIRSVRDRDHGGGVMGPGGRAFRNERR